MFEGWGHSMRNRGCCARRNSEAGNSCRSLAEVGPGAKLRVEAIEGGRSLCARMAALGIYPGASIEVLGNGCNAPCMVKVRGATLSLGVGISHKIKVTQAV